jgi:polyisoprenoid-binding protein YceI
VPSLVLYVFTHRHGIAARLGHDLRLSARGVQLNLQGELLEVRVDLLSLEVDGAIRRGQLDATALNAADRQSILRALQDEILETRRYPEARFRGTVRTDGDQVHCAGELALKERSRALSMELARRGQRVTGQVTIQPSLWGIRPYSAMGGVLKVNDEVELGVELELDAGGPWPPLALA